MITITHEISTWRTVMFEGCLCDWHRQSWIQVLNCIQVVVKEWAKVVRKDSLQWNVRVRLDDIRLFEID